MDILVLNWKDIENPEAGGAEVFIHEIASRWVSAGHRVRMISRMFEGAGKAAVINGVSVNRMGSRFTVYREARRWYERHANEVDVIFETVSTRPFFPHQFRGRPPAVSLFHQTATEIWRYEMPMPVALAGRYLMEPRWLKRYRGARVLAYSRSTQLDLKSHGINDVTLVPIGATVPSPIPSVQKERKPTVVFVGRMSANKRPDHAVKAWRIARQEIPDLQLWMVGSGPMLDKLSVLGDPAIKLFGRVDEDSKFQAMAKAHLLVATSVREGWGLIVTEAAAVGTRPIGYDVPGLRDSLSAAGGTIVPPDPPALAQAIVRHIGVDGGDGFQPVAPTSWDETAARCLDQLELARHNRDSRGL